MSSSILTCALVACLACCPAFAQQDAAGWIASGDQAWARRAVGAPADDPGHAAPGPVREAIGDYQKAIAAAPDDLEARWKLLRSLYFEGEFVARGSDERQKVFDEGRKAAEAALDQLATHAGGRKALEDLDPAERAKRLSGVPEAARLYSLAAAHWGLWGDAFGRFAAARQGVAGKVRDYALTAIALDETVDGAAPHRILGRLHTLAPHIPFLTGWVDRDKAVSELRRAVELAPEEPLNHVYLADAILQFQPQHRAEAVAELQALLDRPPNPENPIEEASARQQARELLREARK
jgi:tetratricopeptide (TPR) repeat protein